MCLLYSEKLTSNFKKNKPDVILCYKIVKKYNNKLQSEFHTSYKWKPNINKSSRKYILMTKLEKQTSRIHYGFHTFISKRAARQYIYNLGHHHDIIIPVICKKENLVGVGFYSGYHSAVFTQMQISDKEYNKIIKS